MTNEVTYPYVEFAIVKQHRAKEGGEMIPAREEVKVRVDGCHGHLDNLMQMVKNGMKVVGHGNLASRYNDIRRWVDGQTGVNQHPLLKDKSAIDERLNERRSAKNQG